MLRRRRGYLELRTGEVPHPARTNEEEMGLIGRETGSVAMKVASAATRIVRWPIPNSCIPRAERET